VKRSRLRARALVLPGLASLLLVTSPAHADPPNGPGYLRLLGARAQAVLEPHASTIGALVRIPAGFAPASVGLQPFVPGFARLRGTSSELLAFADAHPDLPLEVAPPPHLLLNMVGEWTHSTTARAVDGADGTGPRVGIADTGIDFTLADFADPANPGHTRIAWLLDLSVSPVPGLNQDLEDQFGGAVYSGTDLENLLGDGAVTQYDTDTVGHGTHVASIAAGNGGTDGIYVGLAPKAQLIIARVTQGEDETIGTADLLTGVQFLFDRADAMNLPIAVNLSIGSDFGPHDGTMAWEQALAAYVGPDHPGRVLTAAAGNSGDITAEGVHASVYVPPGETRTIPITVTNGGTMTGGGQVQVWITMRGDADLAVGLNGPDGSWIPPVPSNQTGGIGLEAGDGYQAGIDNGSSVSMGMIPTASHSAIALWGGTFPAGTYAITLTGHGVADLYVEGLGDTVLGNGVVAFVDPVREGTVNIPATNAGVIGVGCTVNRAQWTSIDNAPVSAAIGPLDPRGGYANLDGGLYLAPVSGNVCWFSSAGPTVTGVPKPEISAPGGFVIAAMSQWALPTGPWAPYSIFTNPGCPSLTDGGPPDLKCTEVDPTHAVSAGTSMSAPQAAAAAALLFQRDPTLTQDEIVGLLQAGAHPFRTGTPRFEDQGGPGELDVQGSLDALEQMKDPLLALPNKAASWITLSADELTADGSTPLTAIVELRTVDGEHRANLFNASRLAPVVQLDGSNLSELPLMERRAPGVWLFTVTPPPGLGGHTLTLGATFDGEPIVTPKSVAIATDVWTANYPSTAGGGCGVGAGGDRSSVSWWAWAGLGVALCLRRRRRHSLASETIHPCGSQTRSSGSNG
jgi:subtilisin family serine protease